MPDKTEEEEEKRVYICAKICNKKCITNQWPYKERQRTMDRILSAELTSSVVRLASSF